MSTKLMAALGLVLSLWSGLLSAETASLPAAPALPRRFYYVGTLGGDLAIQLDITLDATLVAGTYFYQKFGVPLALSGSITSTGHLTLNEHDAKKRLTGTFRGRLHGAQSDITGTWSSGDGQKTLPFSLTKVADYVVVKTSQGEKIQVETSYPYFVTVAPALQQINRRLEETLLPRHQDFIQQGREIYDDITSYAFTQHYTYRVTFYSPELLSLFAEVSEYTGGAHGNTGYASMHFSIHNGQATLLTLADLFVPASAYLETLSTYCLQSLRTQGATAVVGGEIKRLQAEDLQVFFLSPQGLTFAFAPYHVGPYAQGAFFVTVPYKAVQQVIKSPGPLQALMPRP